MNTYYWIIISSTYTLENSGLIMIGKQWLVVKLKIIWEEIKKYQKYYPNILKINTCKYKNMEYHYHKAMNLIK